MMRKRDVAVLLAAMVGAVVLSGCSSSVPAANSLPDGQYSGQSEADTDGAYGVVDFTVSGGTVTAASFVVYDEDGTPHDESYGLGSDGKPVDETFYQRAQNALAAEKQYVAEFEESGDQRQVESIAGASLSYRMFRAAIDAAIADDSQ